ncbi:MAG: alpha/beta hydrolase [Saprospiraceae bacterium]
MQSSSNDPFTGTATYEQVTSRAATIDLGYTPSSMRAGFTTLLLGENPAADARPLINLGGVEARLSGRDSLDGYSGRVWVWFHGGGYVFGSPETHIRPTSAFAKTTGCPVITPRYRLAPEHVWPAQLDDALAVVRALQNQGLEVALAGDSAGGHLAINTALALAKAQSSQNGTGTPVARLALFSPNTDRAGYNPTRAERDAFDPIVGDAFDVMLGKMCFEDMPVTDPQVSPVLGDLSLLPPTHIEVGGTELLRDDSLAFYAFAKRAGAEITLHETPEAFHMWQVWGPWLEEGQESLERVAAMTR